MATYKCQLCGHIYDEEKEGVKFEDLPDNWKCPMCMAPKSMFKKIEDSKTDDKKDEKETPKNDSLSNYLREYKRDFDEFEKNMIDIHTMATTGESIISAMGTQLPIISWKDFNIGWSVR